MKLLYDLFGESGKLSLMRVQCFVVCVCACYLAFIHPESESLVLGMLGIAIAGKAGQKYIEVNKS